MEDIKCSAMTETVTVWKINLQPLENTWIGTFQPKKLSQRNDKGQDPHGASLGLYRIGLNPVSATGNRDRFQY